MTSTNYIDASVARSYLPPLSLELAIERMEADQSFTEFERSVIYTHYLVARGDFEGLVEFLSSKSGDVRCDIVNHTMHHTWYGNTLNTCTYWNTGLNALTIYRYLVENGARAATDYYGNFPWSVSGGVFICPLRGTNIAPGFNRNREEFITTYDEVHRYFGPGSVDVPPQVTPSSPTLSWTVNVDNVPPTEPLPVDPVVADCRLHRPGSLYTRNSDGHYGSYAPPCNGCSVGRRQNEEYAVVERLRSHTYELQQLWATQYNEETAIQAQNIAGMLSAAITELESMTTAVITPLEYARRTLELHESALRLHTALTGARALESAFDSLRTQIRESRIMGRDTIAPILLAAEGYFRD